MFPPENHIVSCTDSSQPKPVSDLRPHKSNFNNFSSSERTHRAAPVAITRETEHSGRHAQEGCRGMCSDSLDPGGEVRGCSVCCTLGMSDILTLVFIAADRSIGVSRTKKMHFEADVFWVRRDFGQFRTGGAWESRDIDHSRSSQNQSKLQLTPHTAAADAHSD